MRYLGFGLLLCMSFSAHSAKPDPAVYPNPNIYRDPAIAGSGAYAKVIREYCPGGGRGLIHFLNVDGNLIRIRKTWPTYLELAPGRHRLEMEFIGTASDIWSTWNGTAEIATDFEPGKSYIVRYRRNATDSFSVWVEAYDGFETVDMSTVSCMQPDYPDKRLHQ